jgi:hypothetical protein
MRVHALTCTCSMISTCTVYIIIIVLLLRVCTYIVRGLIMKLKVCQNKFMFASLEQEMHKQQPDMTTFTSGAKAIHNHFQLTLDRYPLRSIPGPGRPQILD